MEIEFERRGCGKILQKNPALKAKIETVLAQQAENGFYKAKPATRLKWRSLPILECRVNDPSTGAIRLAFAHDKDRLIVLYLSSTLLKKDFSREIDSFLKEGSR